MQVGELSALRYLTVHNVAWLLRFVDRTAAAIREQRLTAWRAEVLEVWG